MMAFAFPPRRRYRNARMKTKSCKPVSDAEAMDTEIRATCKVLESVAKRYPRDSAERKAIRQAADAFIYLQLHEGLKKSYDAFRRSCTKPRRCKTLSVNCLPSIRLHPSGVRRSDGERSEPSAAEPRRGEDAPRAKNWSRAGHIGFLLGCQQIHPTNKPHGPPHRS